MTSGASSLTGVTDAGLPVVAPLALLAGLVLVRLTLLLTLDLATVLPGRLGRGCGRLGRALRPGLARRLVAAVLGLGIGSLALLPPATAALSGGAATSPGRENRPGRPTLNGALAAATTIAGAETYLVRTGDSLWDIARHHLPDGSSDTAVARAWPRWYLANRALIGSDPALIRPGMRLRFPDLRPTGTSATQHHRPAPTTTATSAWVLSLDPDRR